MSMRKQKQRLHDLEALSRKNAEKRADCLANLSRLPLGATAADITKVIREQYPPLLDEVILAGTRAIMAAVKRANVKPIDFEAAASRQRERSSRIMEAAREVAHRVKIGGAVVEYLDKMMVGGKPLGDCAIADLRREETSLRQRGSNILDQANLLKAIAAHMKPNETVRTAQKRSAILDVLRESFGE